MSAYGVYQIFLANTTIMRMAPQGRRAGGEIKNKGMENEELVRDEDEENERKLKWIHKPRINKN